MNLTCNTVQIREVGRGRVRGRVGSGGSVMGDCVLRHCPSPITAIVYTKYFAKTMAVIGEGQCRNTQSPITDPPDPTLPLTLPGQTSRICTVKTFLSNRIISCVLCVAPSISTHYTLHCCVGASCCILHPRSALWSAVATGLCPARPHSGPHTDTHTTPWTP